MSTSDRAAEVLGEMLRERMTVDGTGPEPVTPSSPMLEWLRRMTALEVYSPSFESHLAAQLGPDLFGIRTIPDVPPFLRDLDIATLPPEWVMPFLRRMSLTRGFLPEAAEFTAEALAGSPGRASSASRSLQQRAWGQENAPLLSEVTMIPQVVHGIWLGGPLPDGTFSRNYAAAADRYAAEVDFVLWTDLTRAETMAALANGPEPATAAGPGNRSAAVRWMLDWAIEHRIHLVNVFEVFNRRNPLLLNAQFAVEMAKLLPRGFAGASDQLRVEIVFLLGGAYVDGDNNFGTDRSGEPLPGRLPELFAEVAGSVHGFTLHMLGVGRGIANDVIVAPAGHPALRLLLEATRVNYRRTQRQLFAGIEQMSQRFVGHRDTLLRHSLVRRTGRCHHDVLPVLGITIDDPRMIRVNHAVSPRSELSWGPNVPSTATRVTAAGRDEVSERVVRATMTLAHHLLTREGNLYLTEVAPVIGALANPDAAWIAIFGLLTQLCRSGLVPEVTSITDLRWDDDGNPNAVTLPPKAESLLDRSWADTGWLGAELAAPGRGVWLMDEYVTPTRFRPPSHEPASTAPILFGGTEPVTDNNDVAVGIWLPTSSGDSTIPADPALVPAGYVGVWLEGRCGAAFAGDIRLHPADVAALLHGHGLSDRPVLLITRTSASDAVSPFGRLLAAQVHQPVLAAVAIRPDSRAGTGP